MPIQEISAAALREAVEADQAQAADALREAVEADQAQAADAVRGRAGGAAQAPAAGADRTSAAGAVQAPGGAPQAQAEFDRLLARSAASRDDLANFGGQTATGVGSPGDDNRANESEQSLSKIAPAVIPAERLKRTEQGLEASVVGERERESESNAVAEAPAAPAAAKLEVSVRTFESELDPFEVGLLGTGHLVMFRNVWRDGRRYVQGALIDREQFLARSVSSPFAASSLAAMSDLGVLYQGQSIGIIRAAAGSVYDSTPRELAGSLLYRTRLSPPFGSLELQFDVTTLPRAPGTLLLVWVSVILAAVLCGGFFLMYRFAAGQLRLARQQQDFVSAVSHELKTPLTSIRMYGEMLKAGWADDAKKQTYYDYIHSESERLSRLIENVLQLARLTRNSQHFDMKRVTVAELMDMVRSKVSTQIEHAGFTLAASNDAPADAEISVDGDAFAQVLINLVDNALKFSAGAERKVVEIASRRESDGRLLFTVRDFGPGIPKGQMKKIFELFYRPENELTRETVGTGIGLALVQQLAIAMGGRVDVRNCEPGAEFRLSFPPPSH
jgi:signal transduction histidine kinase